MSFFNPKGKLWLLVSLSALQGEGASVCVYIQGTVRSYWCHLDPPCLLPHLSP